jgi:tRNA A-37 threonylcarbamoyl transferase component Bud32
MSESLNDRVVAAIGEHYELESEIGRGGMSVVYRARDRRLNRPIAIKVLPPELAHDQAIRVRFTREAQMSAQLSHPHIVPIYDVGERDGIAYFVMALVTGGNLGAVLTREPRQPVEEVRRILAEVADALAYAHLRGVIHRDIKPDNILLDRLTGRAMVTDFGIARAMEAGARLTATGIAVGTPTYMSPEQAIGERELDGRSDIYSTGVLGYQMLTGRVPFEAGNSMALLLKHVTERPRPIADLRPETPRGLRETVERAMMKAPEDRWPTAAALRDALQSESAGPSWRADQREAVRYVSPRPDGSRRVAAVRTPSKPVVRPLDEPAHLASLTPEQRQDLRLWHGRVTFRDRIKAMRGYGVLTLAATVGGIAAFVFGVTEAPPLVLGPIVPMYMWAKLWRRGKSLRESGIRLRQTLPSPHFTVGRKRSLIEQQLEKLAPPEGLESPEGGAIRRAVEDRAAILQIFDKLSKTDRASLPDLSSTVKMLVERVAHLAQTLLRLDQSIDPALGHELDARIAQIEREPPGSPEAERQLSFLRRQRATIDELVQRRVALARQLDSAGLALGSLKLDLIKLRSSGLQSALSDVTSATQEARALSNEIDAVLAAAAEVRNL